MSETKVEEGMPNNYCGNPKLPTTAEWSSSMTYGRFVMTVPIPLSHADFLHIQHIIRLANRVMVRTTGACSCSHATTDHDAEGFCSYGCECNG